MTSLLKYVEGSDLLFIQPTALVKEGPDYSPFALWARFTPTGAAYIIIDDMTRADARAVLRVLESRRQSPERISAALLGMAMNFPEYLYNREIPR